MKSNDQRFYAILMIIGAGILLFRTTKMILAENTFEILMVWVIALLIAELIIDLGCVASAVYWLITGKKAQAKLPLRLATAAIVLHTIRTVIYLIGRTGPWINFDIKPEYRDTFFFGWAWIQFVAILSFLLIIGTIVVWQLISLRKEQAD